jgi:hypothetical protein
MFCFRHNLKKNMTTNPKFCFPAPCFHATDVDFGQWMADFPSFHFVYETTFDAAFFENTTTQKYDFAMVVPLCKGKHFLWKKGSVYLLMELDKDRCIISIQPLYGWKKKHGGATVEDWVVYGSLVFSEKQKEDDVDMVPFFTVEEVYVFQGKVVDRSVVYADKWVMAGTIIVDEEKRVFSSQLTLSLPVMWSLSSGVISELEVYAEYTTRIRAQCGYKAHHIQVRSSSAIAPNLRIGETEKEKHRQVLVWHGDGHGDRRQIVPNEMRGMLIVPDALHMDVYHVYYAANYRQCGSSTYAGMAHIPTITLSLAMRGWFHDPFDFSVIEFSDDEEQEERGGTAAPAPVRERWMNCRFHTGMGKWVPLHLVDEKEVKVHRGDKRKRSEL